LGSKRAHAAVRDVSCLAVVAWLSVQKSSKNAAGLCPEMQAQGLGD